MTHMASVGQHLHKQAVVCMGVLVVCAGLVNPAAAQKPERLTNGEIALLPPYCADSMGLRPGSESGSMGPNANHWFTLMGRSFRHMHHHCWALINERRAKAPGVMGFLREGLLNRVVSDNQYIIDNAEPNFIMLPDVYLKQGDGHLLLKRYSLAIEAYEAALRRKPDYWRPYSRWADALAASGNVKGALPILEEGLRNVTNQVPLREQYKRMGGNLDKFLRTLPPKAAAPAASAAPIPASAASAPGG